MRFSSPVHALLLGCVWLHGCADNPDACGGPTSDFPYCDDEPPGAPSGGAGEGGNNGGAGGGLDPDTGADADGGACQAVPPDMCTGGFETIGVETEVPGGTLTLTQLREHDVAGVSVSLAFYGELEGKPAVLNVTLPNAAFDGRLATGTYDTSVDAGSGASATFSTCSESAQLAVQVEIQTSTAPTLVRDEGLLAGELRVTAEGWSLALPFIVRQLCEREPAP